ncbi:hypothetical protein ACX0G7_01720 [Flavitalea antarctica]
MSAYQAFDAMKSTEQVGGPDEPLRRAWLPVGRQKLPTGGVKWGDHAGSVR